MSKFTINENQLKLLESFFSVYKEENNDLSKFRGVVQETLVDKGLVNVELFESFMSDLENKSAIEKIEKDIKIHEDMIEGLKRDLNRRKLSLKTVVKKKVVSDPCSRPSSFRSSC